MDEISDSVFVVGIDGVIRWANAELERRLGIPKKQLIGLTPDFWLSTVEGNVTAAEAIKHCLRDGTFRFQPRFRARDGSVRMSDVLLRLLCNDDGEPEAIISVSRDVTDLMRLESELLQTQKVKVVGDLAGGVAHDLNNTLAVILGNIELAQLENLPPDIDAHLQQAVEACHRGAEIVRRLLAYARKQPLRAESLSSCEVLREATQMLAPLLGGSHGIEVSACDDLWRVHADASQIQTVMMNLAVNARDAMPEGGSIKLSARNVTVGSGAFAGELAPGDYLEFEVTDTGTGIPKDMLNRVLDPYFTTKEVGVGSGLGLSMAFGFAKQSGGHLWIESEVGRGTTVRLLLPRTRDPAEGREGIRTAHAPGYGLLRVFLLEDNAELLRTTSEMLRRAGHRVLTADSYEAAWAALDEVRECDVCLLDVMLPGDRNGTDFAEALERAGIDVPVVFMSGKLDAVREAEGTSAAKHEMLQKPFTAAELANLLGAVVNRAGHGSAMSGRGSRLVSG